MNCPSCKSANVKNVISETVYLRDCEVPMHIDLCLDCNYAFQSSAYQEGYDGIIGKIYADYIKNYADFPSRTAQLKHSIELLVNNAPDKKFPNILEIGSNRGDFLYMVKERLPLANILGVEPSVVNHPSVPTVVSMFKKGLISGKFDVIILQYVFEHIKNPREFFAVFGELLTDDGILYIEVPNVKYLLKNKIDDFILDHVSYFTLKTINDIADNFQLVDFDTTMHLKCVFRKSDIKTDAECGLVNEEQFREYNESKNALMSRILDLVQDRKKIVFYGAGYYLRTIYREIATRVERSGLGCEYFYHDDNVVQDEDAIFNIRKIDGFDSDCIVIISIKSAESQAHVFKKLKQTNIPGMAVIRPWSAIDIF